MTKVLITGAGSYVGESVKKYILATSTDFEIDSVDMMNDAWKQADFTKYDVVFHVAGIAHVNADPKMEPLYYKVNRDLTVEVAKQAKESGVKQFIFMSSQIVFHESKSSLDERHGVLPAAVEGLLLGDGAAVKLWLKRGHGQSIRSQEAHLPL